MISFDKKSYILGTLSAGGGGEGGVIVNPLSIIENGIYTALPGYAYNPVTVNVPQSTPTLQTKTVNLVDTTQTITADSGFYGLESVTVIVPNGEAVHF